MLKDEILIPAGKEMAFGFSIDDLIDNAMQRLSAVDAREYRAEFVIGCPVGIKKRLEVLWHSGDEKYNFNRKYYGKVKLVRLGYKPKYCQESLFPIEGEHHG